MAAIIGLIVCAVSGVICIVGLAIPYWAVNAISDSVHYGLWTGCNAVMCLDYVLVTSSLKAVRAFEILGMLLVGGAVLLALLQLVVLKDKLVILKLAGLCAAVAGVLMIIGTVIFAAKTMKEYASFHDLHAGFALCIISGVGSIVGGVLFLINRAPAR